MTRSSGGSGAAGASAVRVASPSGRVSRGERRPPAPPAWPQAVGPRPEPAGDGVTPSRRFDIWRLIAEKARRRPAACDNFAAAGQNLREGLPELQLLSFGDPDSSLTPSSSHLSDSGQWRTAAGGGCYAGDTPNGFFDLSPSKTSSARRVGLNSGGKLEEGRMIRRRHSQRGTQRSVNVEPRKSSPEPAKPRGGECIRTGSVAMRDGRRPVELIRPLLAAAIVTLALEPIPAHAQTDATWLESPTHGILQ
jgi:hypothetical protein